MCWERGPVLALVSIKRWLFYLPGSLYTPPFVSVSQKLVISVSFCHRPKKAHVTVLMFFFVFFFLVNNKTSHHTPLSSAQIKFCRSIASLFYQRRGTNARQGELYKRYFCYPRMRTAAKLYLLNSEDSDIWDKSKEWITSAFLSSYVSPLWHSDDGSQIFFQTTDK